MLRRVALLSLGLALAAPRPAQAQVIDGTSGVQIITLTVGTFAGLTNVVATIVYAAQGRSFDDGWIVSSFVAGAICGAFAVGLTAEASEEDQGFLMGPATGYYLTALVPLAWAVRSGLSPVDPGERFDAAEAELAPVSAVDPWRSRSPAPPATFVGLPAVRF